MKDSPCARETLPILERKDGLDNTYKAVLEMGEAAQVARDYDKVLRSRSSFLTVTTHLYWATIWPMPFVDAKPASTMLNLFQIGLVMGIGRMGTLDMG